MVTRCWSTPAPIPKDAFEQRFGLHLIPGGGYGSTDAGWVVVPQWDHPGGKILPHFDVKIMDENDDFLPAGEIGEIVIRPKEAGVMSDGYFGRPDKTNEARRNLWFHTGDLGGLMRMACFISAAASPKEYGSGAKWSLDLKWKKALCLMKILKMLQPLAYPLNWRGGCLSVCHSKARQDTF